MEGQFLAIFLRVVLPILVLAGLGAAVQRFWPLDTMTLSRLNIYLFVPAFLFMSVYKSTLSAAEIGQVVLGVLAPMAVLALPLGLLLLRRRTSGNTAAAVIVGALVFNAGNYGIPLAGLLYQGVSFPGMKTAADGLAVQSLVVMVSNMLVWGLGYLILSLAKGGGWKQALGYFRLPMLYVLVAAFALRWVKDRCFGGTDPLPQFLAFPLQQVADAVIPVALVTLGAQMAQRAHWPRWRIVGPVMVIKLLVLPATAGVVAWLLGMWPWPGAQLVIAAAAPTAVNTLLLTIELDGDADLAADIVFWTTVGSAVTVTLVLGALALIAAAPPIPVAAPP